MRFSFAGRGSFRREDATNPKLKTSHTKCAAPFSSEYWRNSPTTAIGEPFSKYLTIVSAFLLYATHHRNVAGSSFAALQATVNRTTGTPFLVCSSIGVLVRFPTALTDGLMVEFFYYKFMLLEFLFIIFCFQNLKEESISLIEEYIAFEMDKQIEHIESIKNAAKSIIAAAIYIISIIGMTNAA